MKKLRNKLIRIVLLCVIAVFLLISGVLFVVVRLQNIYQADLMTQIICDNNGSVPTLGINERPEDSYPTGFNAESAYTTRYFIVYFDSNGHTSYTNMDFIVSVTEDEALEMAVNVLDSGREVGFFGSYRYRVSYSNGTAVFIVFLDYSENESNTQNFMLIMGVILIGFTLLIAVIFAICSRFVLRPFEENSKRQKQFITDASHELKTPLTIISANAQVLEYKTGKNEWTTNIREETRHMGKLIEDLLILSKLQESETSFMMERVNFSDTTSETAEKFREVVETKQCSLALNIQPDIFVNGNSEQLAQVPSILLDNASKYVTEGGHISIELGTSGKNAVLKVFNTADMPEDFDYSKLFERFYRADSSHSSQTGGHGIGLSIIKRIADFHKGSVKAAKKDDGILFTFTVPTNLKIK